MSYESNQGEEIKAIILEIETIIKIFDRYASKDSTNDEALAMLDSLEYDLVNSGEISELV